MNGQGSNSITLNDNYTNYDYLDVYYAQSNWAIGAARIIRVPTNITAVITIDMMYRAVGVNNETIVSQRGIAFGLANNNQMFTDSTRSFTIDFRINDISSVPYIPYNGPDAVNYGPGNYDSIAIYRVDGIKEH